jgi:heat shock protein HslJ
LGNALQLGQIDLAIAAISVTPERSAAVDFSNIYFVTEDAILAQTGSENTVNSPQDMAGKRISVQNKSVQQEWAQTQLVDTGLVAPSDLLVYREIDKAIDDLAKGYTDYVILDLPPAQVAVEQGGFVIAGQGLNRQRFGIAMPKGASVLQAQLNRALGELQASGRIEELASTYLGLDEEDLIPIPTPNPQEPTPTPVPTAPPPACIDGMQWVADLSYPDNGMQNPPQMAPGQPFVKGWRVRNTGTCAWDSSFALVHAGGNTAEARMGGQPAVVDRNVQPGETYDFNVSLVAPLTPGVYQAFWTMRNGAGQLFGDRVWVGIVVVGPATATPLPTQTPSPSIQFSVDRTKIKQGECVNFSWNVQGVQAVYFYPDGQSWQESGVPGQATRTECPPSTITYNLRVVYNDGATEVRKIRIEVEPAAVDAPRIAQFSVNPEGQITVGQCVDIRWDVQGQVNNVRIVRGGTDLWNPAPVAGQIQDCPPGPGSYQYSLEATGPGGSSRAQRNVTVVQPTGAPPTPTPVPATPVPDPPVINAFGVSPAQIKVGQCVQISWRTSGGTTLVQILRNGVIVLDSGPLEGSGQDCLNNTGNYTYSLIASNRTGQQVTRDGATTVTEGAPQNPLANTNWQLAAMNVNQLPLPNTNITAFFDTDGGVGGNSGCNAYSATYTVNGGSITVGPASGGGALCGPDIDQQEQIYLTNLQSAATFEIGGGQLIIRDGTGQEVLRYNELAAVPLAP